MTFSSVQYKPLGPLVAMTNIATGELTLNSDVWDKLPDWIQRYIILHEEGHLFYKSVDEEKANYYARVKFIDKSSAERFRNTTSQLEKIREIYEATTPERKDSIKELNNPNVAGFWQFVAAVFKFGADALKKNQERRENDDNSSKAEDQKTIIESNETIEELRIKRAYMTFLPILTAVIVVITLMIITRK